MSRTYKTANGASINLDNLILTNEETIAIGNMGVNARGDELGPGGKVVANRNKNMDAYYGESPQKDSATEAALKRRQQNRPTRTADLTQHLTPEELELELEAVEETEEPTQKKQLRGRLAGEVSKQVIVPEPEIPTTKQSKGPQRI